MHCIVSPKAIRAKRIISPVRFFFEIGPRSSSQSTLLFPEEGTLFSHARTLPKRKVYGYIVYQCRCSSIMILSALAAVRCSGVLATRDVRSLSSAFPSSSMHIWESL